MEPANGQEQANNTVSPLLRANTMAGSTFSPSRRSVGSADRDYVEGLADRLARAETDCRELGAALKQVQNSLTKEHALRIECQEECQTLSWELERVLSANGDPGAPSRLPSSQSTEGSLEQERERSRRLEVALGDVTKQMTMMREDFDGAKKTFNEGLMQVQEFAGAYGEMKAEYENALIAAEEARQAADDASSRAEKLNHELSKFIGKKLKSQGVQCCAETVDAQVGTVPPPQIMESKALQSDMPTLAQSCGVQAAVETIPADTQTSDTVTVAPVAASPQEACRDEEPPSEDGGWESEFSPAPAVYDSAVESADRDVGRWNPFEHEIDIDAETGQAGDNSQVISIPDADHAKNSVFGAVATEDTSGSGDSGSESDDDTNEEISEVDGPGCAVGDSVAADHKDAEGGDLDGEAGSDCTESDSEESSEDAGGETRGVVTIGLDTNPCATQEGEDEEWGAFQGEDESSYDPTSADIDIPVSAPTQMHKTIPPLMKPPSKPPTLPPPTQKIAHSSGNHASPRTEDSASEFEVALDPPVGVLGADEDEIRALKKAEDDLMQELERLQREADEAAFSEDFNPFADVVSKAQETQRRVSDTRMAILKTTEQQIEKIPVAGVLEESRGMSRHNSVHSLGSASDRAHARTSVEKGNDEFGDFASAGMDPLGQTMQDNHDVPSSVTMRYEESPTITASKHILYRVRIRMENGDCHEIEKKFSDFVALRDTLTARFPDWTFPPIQHRTLWPNKHSSYKRRLELAQTFFDAILLRKGVSSSEEVLSFLDVDSAIAKRKSRASQETTDDELSDVEGESLVSPSGSTPGVKRNPLTPPRTEQNGHDPRDRYVFI